MKTILVPHDLSEPSRTGLVWGGMLAKLFSASLEVVHILGDSEVLREEVGFDGEKIRQQLSNEVQREVESVFSKKPFEKLSKVSVEVFWGRVIPSLLSLIESRGPDLVVVGTHGRTGLKHVLLGSVAENMVRYSSSPVLVAKSKPTAAIRNILIPTDFSPYMEEALLLASQIAKLDQQIAVHVLHVIGMPEVIRFYPGSSEGVAVQINEEKLCANAMKEMEARLAPHSSTKASPHVVIGSVVEEVNKFIQSESIDLVVLPTHGRSGLAHLFLGSVAENLVRYANASLLVFAPGMHAQQRKKYLKHAAFKVE